MAESYFTTSDGVRINVSHLGPSQLARVKAMGTGAKANALAVTLTKDNAANSGIKPRADKKVVTSGGGGNAGGIGKTVQDAMNTVGIQNPVIPDPTPTPVPAPTGSPINDPAAAFTNTPTKSNPIDTPVDVKNPVGPKGHVDVAEGSKGTQDLASDAAIKNFNLNNPNVVTDANGNVRTTTLNADGTTSITNTAGAGLKASQDAFTGALGTVASNGALNLSGAPQIDASGTGRTKAQDAVYNYITKTYQRDKARELETAKQELAQRGIPINSDPNSAWGKTVAQIDEKYQSLDDQAHNQAITQGNQYFATDVSAQKTAYDAFFNSATAEHDRGLSDAATLGGVVNSQQPSGMPAYAGSQYDDQANNYVSLVGLSVQQIMQKYGIDQAEATKRQAIANANHGGGSSGSSSGTGNTDSFGGEAP